MTKEENTKSIKKIVGENVKSLRNAKKMSQADLIEVWGYAQESSISNLENGHLDISISRLEEISNYFGVSIAYMCEEHDCNNVDLGMAIKERIDAEQYKDIIKAAVLMNSLFANLVPESYQEGLLTEIGNVLKSNKES